MERRGLNLEMIANLYDVVERRFSKMSSWFESSLANRVKDAMSKEFHRFLRSWSLMIWKRFIWLVRRLVRDRRWHSKVEVEEVGFFYQFMESNTESTEKLEVFAKDIPNLFDVEMEIGFHD